MPDRVYRIPESKLGDGILQCHRSASDLFKTAEAAVEMGNLSVAVGLYILALEEVGKAKLLSDVCQKRRGDSFEILEKSQFKDHSTKLQAALDLLDDPGCRSYVGGSFSAAFSGAFSRTVPLTWEQRLDLWFVAWDPSSQTFRKGAAFDVANVKRIGDCVRRALGRVLVLAKG